MMSEIQTITIVDYGAGNLQSVANAVRHLGYSPLITSEPAAVRRAALLILPGVGAAGDTMRSLRQRGLVEPLREAASSGRPFLAVCIGLQVLFTATEEGGRQACLDIVPGTVRHLPPGPKVPHMGWNQVRQLLPHPIFAGIPDGSNFYFVHSYYATPQDPACVAGVTENGISFCSMVIRGNLVATQFHPEKSGACGLRLYDNFIRWGREIAAPGA